MARNDGIKLMADDTPFINHMGKVYPFLFRMGLAESEAKALALSETALRQTTNSERTKTLIDLTKLPSQIDDRSLACCNIFIGRWTTAAQPRLKVASNWYSLQTLLRDCVIGLGIPQVAELTLQLTTNGIIDKSVLAWRRLIASSALSNQSRCIKLYLCQDRKLNAAKIRDFLQNGST